MSPIVSLTNHFRRWSKFSPTVPCSATRSVIRKIGQRAEAMKEILTTAFSEV